MNYLAFLTFLMHDVNLTTLVIDHLTNFRHVLAMARFKGKFVAPFSQRWENYTKFWEYIGQSSTPPPAFVFDFRHVLSVSKRWRLKGDWSRKSRPNFRLLTS